MLAPIIADNNCIVFGSFAGNLRGNDIDILSVGNDESAKEIVKRFGKTYGKKIHLVAARKLPERTMMKELMKQHIIFSGFEMFIKSFREIS
jgi:hypothetical protein